MRLTNVLTKQTAIRNHDGLIHIRELENYISSSLHTKIPRFHLHYYVLCQHRSEIDDTELGAQLLNYFGVPKGWKHPKGHDKGPPWLWDWYDVKDGFVLEIQSTNFGMVLCVPVCCNHYAAIQVED